jgi:uncharacterized membrane protein YccC
MAEAAPPQGHALVRLFHERRAELRHALRVAVAAAVSFALATLLNLPQGYWAVITAIVVVQTSIGGTLAASRDRLLGTAVGALVGGFAALVRPQTPLGEGLALTACVGLLSVVASLRPSLKIAPVTAVIMLVGSTAAHSGTLEAAGLRVAEIAVGSIIGVLVTLFVLPPRARDAVSLKVQASLRDQAELLALYAKRLRGEETDAALTPLHGRIRAALNAIETTIGEARRENNVRLTSARVPEAIPRSLWRLRSDMVMIGRASGHPWPEPVSKRLADPAASLMEAQVEALHALARCLAEHQAPAKPDLADRFAAFREAFGVLEKEVPPGALSFELLEQIFGLAYGLEAFNRNLSDLAERLGEFVKGRRD